MPLLICSLLLEAFLSLLQCQGPALMTPLLSQGPPSGLLVASVLSPWITPVSASALFSDPAIHCSGQHPGVAFGLLSSAQKIERDLASENLFSEPVPVGICPLSAPSSTLTEVLTVFYCLDNKKNFSVCVRSPHWVPSTVLNLCNPQNNLLKLSVLFFS